MPRYIEIDEKKVKQLMREAQQFQDDIVCAIGTDFMQKIAEAENKMIFDILKGLVTEPTSDVVPRSEVEELKWQLEREREYIEFLKTNLIKAKHDTTSDIFVEIEEHLIESDTLPNCARLVDLDNLAELKKKYIGE